MRNILSLDIDVRYNGKAWFHLLAVLLPEQPRQLWSMLGGGGVHGPQDSKNASATPLARLGGGVILQPLE